MREIKFKGKRKNFNEWVVGSFFWEYREDTRFACISTRDNRKHYIKQHTISQFTGLKDKNGVEIYEGDIVRYPDDNRDCTVIYVSNCYGACFLTDSHDGIHSLGDVMNILEVIGNIHDKDAENG